MDNETPKTETDWVDDRMATLGPPSNWRPDSDRAFERFVQRQHAKRTPGWIQVSLAAATIAGIGVVLALLPWHVLWNRGEGRKTVVAEPVKAAMPAVPPQPVPAPTSLAEPKPSALPIERQAQAPVPAQGESENAQAKSSGVTAPVIISMVEARYTDAAREAHIQGTVTLSVLVRADGTAKVTKVIQGLGYGLDENAIIAIEESKFRPGSVDGKPVDVQLSIAVGFHLI